MKLVEIWHTLFSGKAAIEIDSPLGKPLRLFKVTLLSQVLFLGCAVPLSVHPKLVSKVIELEPFSTIADNICPPYALYFLVVSTPCA